jgi:hypothetical protein
VAAREIPARKRVALAALLVAAAAVIPLCANETVRDITVYGFNRLQGERYSIGQRLDQFAPAVRARLSDEFAAAGVAWPPRELSFLAFKDVRHLEVYARNRPGDAWRFIKDYRVLGASGTLGPKLMAGDRQVPEGIYRADALNPNSRFHLSIHVNYPNAFDREIAQRDGRGNLGGDIMIHGARASDGCLAMGNDAAEDLFVLAALAGDPRVRIIISPTDFRDPTSRVPHIVAPWLRELYLAIRTELQQYPAPVTGR